MYSDNKLISKIKKKNDRQAADELVSRYYREVYAFAYRQTGDMDLAMDLTQDIFIAVIKGITSFNEKKAQFRTWLYSVASNKITDYFRSKYHHQKIREESIENMEDAYVEDNVLDKIISKDTVNEIMKIVIQYDNEWVKIFQQKIFLDRTFKEIALELGISENTVKTRYYCLIKKIKEEVRYDGER